MPSPKRKKSDPFGTSQFGAKVCSPRSIAKASKGFVPPNTAASTRWARGNFDAWQVWRNGMNLGDPVPDNLLESRNADELNKWLSLYVKESKRQDGESYPTSTKNQLLSGLKRYTVEKKPDAPNFLDEKDGRFSQLRGVRDTVNRELREKRGWWVCSAS